MENSINNNQCAVNVAVRIRPLLKNELTNIIQTVENEPQVLIVQDRRNIFAFDHVFTSTVKQNEIYDATVKTLISKVISGFNCTVLAYGQTGTGKTYTMGFDPQIYNEDVGLISRLLDDFFNCANTIEDNLLSVSFIEIYNEKVYDLLSTKPAFLNVKGFKIQNMTCVNVRDSAEAYHWLHIGSKVRHTGHTSLNSNSSRSHAVFTIYFTTPEGVTSKFHLVDLAGSESVRRTGTEGKAFREGITINKGLLTVGRVINALSNNDKVIPYRDSMLTTILQDSLNIKNHVVLIACVSPNIVDLNETLATLRFAETTKAVKGRPQLESIATKFEKLCPRTFEKLTVPSTPFKRKAGTVFYPLTTIKKKLKSNNYSFTPILSSSSKYSPKKSISSPKCFNNDTLSISTSTAIEPVHLSYSPLVRRCTEALQSSMMQHLDTLVKTHLSIAQTPARDKENVSNNIPWNTVQSKISEMVKNELIQLTAQKTKETSTGNEDRSHITSKRLLNFYSDDNQLDTKMNDIRKSDSSLFKMPSIKSMLQEPSRRSTRLSVLKDSEKNILCCHSPVILKHQRRSMRLSMKMPKAHTPAPTPAPRKNIEESPRKIPIPAPRKNVKKTTPKKVQNKKNKKHYKSARSAHYEYILETLNFGTLKELQMLPTIGAKTAVQIHTYRNLQGQFQNFMDLSKMTGWRGKGYERFMMANHLEIFMMTG